MTFLHIVTYSQPKNNNKKKTSKEKKQSKKKRQENDGIVMNIDMNKLEGCEKVFLIECFYLVSMDFRKNRAKLRNLEKIENNHDLSDASKNA